MKQVIQKNTLSFSCSKKMLFLRTPVDIWKELSEEFNFTCDMCASDENHLVDKYYTIDNSALDKDWDGEVGYVHPLFDGKFVFLLPSSTHTRYFHKFFYKRDNVEIRFLEKPTKGFRFGKDDGTPDEPNSTGYIKPLMICIMKNEN